VASDHLLVADEADQGRSIEESSINKADQYTQGCINLEDSGLVYQPRASLG
jgi:hypothetical protein